MATSSISSNSRQAFEKRLDDIKPAKSDINRVIMDYLVSEGYPAAASRFAKEANIAPRANPESIQARVDIRSAIHRGDIQVAIERINDLSPEILDVEPSLHFSLLRLHLIELIRHSTVTQNSADLLAVFDFAQNHLAPRAPTHPEFQEDLEKAMALLIYPNDGLNADLKALLNPGLRMEVANKVNQAILYSQGMRREARIKGLIRLRAWAENECRQFKKNLPASAFELDLDGDEGKDTTMSENAMQGNGVADVMIT